MMTVWWDTTVGNKLGKEIYQKRKNKNFFPVLSGVRAAGACLVRMYLGERERERRFSQTLPPYQLSQLSSSTRKKKLRAESGSLLYRNAHEGLKYETETLQTNYRLSHYNYNYNTIREDWMLYISFFQDSDSLNILDWFSSLDRQISIYLLDNKSS